MTKQRPDFTDVIYADGLARDAARKGLEQAEAGDKKAARDFYAEAVKWSKEAERFEKILQKKRQKRQSARTSFRAPGRRPLRPNEDLSASRSPRQPSSENGARRRGKSGRGR